jgi:hypothetical protein
MPTGIKNKYTINKPIKHRFKEEEVIAAIHRACGARTFICKALDCTSRQLTNYLDANPHLKQELIEARAAIVDEAEQVIWQALKSEDENIRLKAAIKTVEALGRDRGWALERGQPPMNIQVNVTEKQAEIKAIFGIDEQAIDVEAV